MKKSIGYIALLFLTGFTSCKEYGVSINSNDNLAEDTTYVSKTPEPAELKNFLVEELNGVKCGACPEGAAFLEKLNGDNDHRFRIIAIHQGTLTDMITNREPKSIQDLSTGKGGDGSQILNGIFGEQGSKPTACFDRWPQGTGTNVYLADGANQWPPRIAEMKKRRDKTPVNLKVESKYNTDKDQYDITVTLHYTQAVKGENKLFIYLTENNIKDAFTYSDTLITYNHVFRKAVTDPVGRPFLVNVNKEPGRVYIYRAAVKVDKTDARQKFWVPENMKVVAFVSNPGPDDKSVLQVQETDFR
ncbi:Omp28-related outer membrane protein [Taibaiella chishuiensis]|uniref:Outer membrane protein Omp28 n=1 Tax=Taibaiella chishuiensis TaxID=1434707 RepID=A0A2P8CZA3_9BACT|nr:Omp28-related outer membrane protein [Taibaiella chishuiensis]PSK90299.1 outer membrane protein Omp28 [Taibaiella chishuiensis]